MANRRRGEIAAELGGKSYALCLTLGALAELESAFGVSGLTGLAQRFEANNLSARDLICIIGAEPEAPGPYSADWAEATRLEALADAGARHLVPHALDAWQPGDVLLFRWRAHVPAKHLAIAASRETMIHAHDGACVAEVALTDWWLRRLAYVFAFPWLHHLPEGEGRPAGSGG